jgi:hypothetical protein
MEQAAGDNQLIRRDSVGALWIQRRLQYRYPRVFRGTFGALSVP